MGNRGDRADELAYLSVQQELGLTVCDFRVYPGDAGIGRGVPQPVGPG